MERVKKPGHSALSGRFALAWKLVAVAALAALLLTALRWRYEHSFGRVQIVLDLDDVSMVADGAQIPRDRMLRALKARGATGLALNEQTLGTLRDNGRIAVTSHTQALKLFPQLRESFADARLSYLIWNASDARLMRQIQSHLQEQAPRDGPIVAVTLVGGARGILVPASPQLFHDTTVGYDEAHLEMARKAGLRPVALLSNRLNIDAARLAKRLDEARATGARLVLFDDETLGFETLNRELATGLRARGLSFGVTEFTPQRGTPDVAESGNGNLYRVHIVAPNEAAKWKREELADRYARAARERNVRVLLVRLLRHTQQDERGKTQNLFATNLRFLELIRQQLGAAPPWISAFSGNASAREYSLALRTGESGPFDDFPRAQLRRFGGTAPMIQISLLWLCSLGVVGAWLLLANLVWDCNAQTQRKLAFGGAVLVALLVLAGTAGIKLLAFGAAVAWPAVAFAWGGWPEAMRAQRFDAPTVAKALLRTTALSVGGGLLVAALLCDWRFLSKTTDFWGTKPAQMFSLALAAVFIGGDFSPRDAAQDGAASARHRLREYSHRVLASGFTIRLALLGAAFAFALWLWMARSGNDSGLEVSPFEWQLRARLEEWLMARPRNKELFGAYPAFVVSLWCAARGLKTPARVLALVASVAPIDIINSFCQANNPLALSLWRSMWGAVLGGAIGAFCAAILHAPHANCRVIAAQMRPTRAHLRFAAVSVFFLVCLVAALRFRAARSYAWLTAPSSDATWPWRNATREELSTGVTHWLDTSAQDGTTLDLLEFDFARDPRLRFGLYDRDEDDTAPFDNRVPYWNEGLAPIAAKMQRRGELVTLVNGSFFGLLNRKPRSADRAFHLAPIVLRGRIHYAGTNHRWTFGTQRDANNKTHFAVEHLPSRAQLQRFEFASGTAQCVVKNGVALRLEPLPHGRVALEPPLALASTREEAGHIRVLDWMKTSRVSFGWNREGTKLWLLLVKEPDGETPSRAFVHGARRGAGGWTLAEVQRFWMAQGADNAVVTDGGDVAQLAFREPAKNRWLLVPPRFSTSRGAATRRFSINNWKDAPEAAQVGGALMYFGVWRE